MANADGRLFNVDRWTIYTLQRLYPNTPNHVTYRKWCGNMVVLTPAQYRRMKKKMLKNDDYSVGLTLNSSGNR